MKNKFFKLKATVILLLVSLAFVSCGGEVEEKSADTSFAVSFAESSELVSSADEKEEESSAVESSFALSSEDSETVEETSEQPLPEHNKEGFVLVTDIVPDAVLEIRYYSTFNFVGERIDYYEAPVAYITKEGAQALKRASDDLMAQGYRIKIFDAYRPQSAVDHFKRWAQDPAATEMKPYFYPDVDKENLFAQGYISSKSGHSRGSTVDLTIIDMVSGREVDMGGSFDYFGELSRTYYENLTEEQIKNRSILRNAMIKAGFRPVTEEWWHFTLNNEPYADIYFDFPITMP